METRYFLDRSSPYTKEEQKVKTGPLTISSFAFRIRHNEESEKQDKKHLKEAVKAQPDKVLMVAINSVQREAYGALLLKLGFTPIYRHMNYARDVYVYIKEP